MIYVMFAVAFVASLAFPVTIACIILDELFVDDPGRS